MYPEAILSAVFCMVCRFVSASNGDQRVLPYSSIGLVIVLYVAVMVSLLFPHLVVVRAFSMFIDLVALSLVIFVRSEKLSFGSYVIPSILGCLTVGI